MKVVVGIFMGFFSAFLLYMMAVLLVLPYILRSSGTEPPSAMYFAFLIFVFGWVLSSVFLIRHARSVSKVFSRGFLLGAAEWFVMIGVGVVTVATSHSKFPPRPMPATNQPCKPAQ